MVEQGEDSVPLHDAADSLAGLGGMPAWVGRDLIAIFQGQPTEGSYTNEQLAVIRAMLADIDDVEELEDIIDGGYGEGLDNDPDSIIGIKPPN